MPCRQMRAHPIMKFCEDVRASVGCAEDAVRACVSVCTSSGLQQVRNVRPSPNLDACSLAMWLAKHLLLCAGDTLCQRRLPQELWHVLLACWILCMSWLFPEKGRWRRSSACVEPLWASSSSCRTLLWLSGQSGNKWPAKVLLLLAPHHRWALCRRWRPRDWTMKEVRAAVDDLLFLQLLAVFKHQKASELFDSTADPLHALYAWVSPRGYYVGVAGVEKKQSSQCRSCLPVA